MGIDGCAFPGRGIAIDLRGRLLVYRDDWIESVRPQRKRRIAAASTYIFFASAIPALAFGQQLYLRTDGAFNIVHVLASTAIAGVTQSVLGGQPLLIIGVAEPIVLVYGYMYDFARAQSSLQYGGLFLPWASWCCVWTSVLCVALAVSNACYYIVKFTRFAGELFGMLIAVLFLQQAVKGLVHEFSVSVSVSGSGSGSVTVPGEEYSWQLVNGIWSLFLALGLLLSSLLVRRARSWRFLFGPIRAFLADYGVPVMIVTWTAASFAVSGAPAGIPSRVSTPDTWAVTGTWSVASRMGQVPGAMIAAALVPALVMTVLFFFDHNVSSQMAQQPEFGLGKPAAYHWDFLLLGGMELLCGLLGLPPVNGVLPQAPMHTKSLAKLVAEAPEALHGSSDSAPESMHISSDSASLVTNSQAPVGPELSRQTSSGSRCGLNGLHQGPAESISQLQCAGDGAAHGFNDKSVTREVSQKCDLAISREEGGVPGQQPSQQHRERGSTSLLQGDPAPRDQVIKLQVTEQRASNLLQSLAVGACLALTPAIRLIPSAVLWGYFAFMAIESLPGSQFWDRLLLLLTDPTRRHVLLERGHAAYLETVPFKVIAAFTLLQAALLAAVYGLTWAGVAGILFPVPIMLLVPFREWAMPLVFRAGHLQELDMIRAEEAPPVESHDLHRVETEGLGFREDPGRLGGNESEVISEELVHFQVKHHISRDSLEQRLHSTELENVPVTH